MHHRADQRRLRRMAITVVAMLAFAVVAATTRSPELPGGRVGRAGDDRSPVRRLLASDIERVERFCSDCHALPRPVSFARDRWHFEVRHGFEFYARSGRSDLDPPSIAAALAYYRDRAPQRLTFPEAKEASVPCSAEFVPETISVQPIPGVLSELAHLQWVRLSPEREPILAACDLRYGHLLAVDLNSEQRDSKVLAQLRNPARIEVCDLNSDGTQEILVADLGSYLSLDHYRGRVVVLVAREGTAGYETVELVTGVGRVADVRPADFDGDGRLDLVVAEFGLRDTGSIFLLRNISTPGEPLNFQKIPLDDRPGAIHVPIHDFNEDGRPDFAAVVSQEFESVDLFLNEGEFRFHRHNAWSAPDVTFGSSGISLSDLNGDGSMDVLFTNGDSFDNSYVNPGQGIQWLENVGGSFEYHRLTELPGAFRALAEDFDSDGDRDIIAVAWPPPNAVPEEIKSARLASLVYLEQAEPGVFSRHTLQWEAPFYSTVEIGDFDRDGKPDFATALGWDITRKGVRSSPLTIWWNRSSKHD